MRNRLELKIVHLFICKDLVWRSSIANLPTLKVSSSIFVLCLDDFVLTLLDCYILIVMSLLGFYTSEEIAIH